MGFGIHKKLIFLEVKQKRTLCNCIYKSNELNNIANKKVLLKNP